MRNLLLAGLVCACTLAAQPDPGAGSIAGHVFNSLTSVPIRKARVTLTAPEIRLVADTDAEGGFQFTGLPPGTYRLSGSRLGFLDHPARRPIPLGPNDRVTDAEIRLPPAGVITGRVIDEDGEPVDRARVWIFKQIYRRGRKVWDRLNTSSETSESGEYRFPNLTRGRYLLQAHDQRPAINNQYGNPPKMFYVPAYYPNALSQHDAVPVEVGTGSQVRDIDIRLSKLARPPSVRVRGKVSGMPPGSQAIISVGLARADGGFFGGGGTRAEPPDYAFELSAPPGEYTIVGIVYSGDARAYGTGRLTLTGEAAGVVLAMNPAAEIRGRISLAESGSQVKLQQLRVSLADIQYDSGVRVVRSDATGKLVFGELLRPGHYALDMRSIPDGCFVRDVKLGGREISPDDFEIVASAQLEIVLSSTAGTIAGSVSDADGKPSPNSSVTLIPRDSRSRPVRQSVDENGKFRISGLRPGTYQLLAWEEVDDDAWQDPEFRKPYESRATEITVGPSRTEAAQLTVIPPEEMR